MTRPLRLECEGALWHVTSRGNERREIFRDRNDRSTFIELLGSAVTDAHWCLHAYVLMNNHYHLLIETPERTLSSGAKQLNERWAEYFNWRYGRVGHLFQDRFKSIPVEREGHLLELVRYIVLNPVRCGAVVYAADYEWSNYRATAGLQPAPEWLHVEWTLRQFHEDRETAREMYRMFVADARGATYCPWETLGVTVTSKAAVPAEFKPIADAVCREFGETSISLRQKSRRPARKPRRNSRARSDP